MVIAVIGAGGSVGRVIAQMIVSERLLACDQRLILVGNPEGASASSLPGYAVDLMDAYAEITPQIEVVLAPEAIEADLIVMAGGATVPHQPRLFGDEQPAHIRALRGGACPARPRARDCHLHL